MKSTVLSLFILILIFILFKYGFLSVLSSQTFHIIAIAVLVIVLAAAAYFVGFDDKNNNTGQTKVPTTKEDEADEK